MKHEQKLGSPDFAVFKDGEGIGVEERERTNTQA
jgi:hypothetical protein